MSTLDELRDELAQTSAIIPLSLGLFAHARPLIEALRAAARDAPLPAAGPAPAPQHEGGRRPEEALRLAVLGYLAFALRVEGVIEEAARPDGEPTAAPPRAPRRRGLLR